MAYHISQGTEPEPDTWPCSVCLEYLTSRPPLSQHGYMEVYSITMRTHIGRTVPQTGQHSTGAMTSSQLLPAKTATPDARRQPGSPAPRTHELFQEPPPFELAAVKGRPSRPSRSPPPRSLPIDTGLDCCLRQGLPDTKSFSCPAATEASSHCWHMDRRLRSAWTGFT